MKKLNTMTNKKNTFKEFDWIIKILNSSENNKHLECVKNCFFLWEKMNIPDKISRQELKIVNHLRSSFWARYHTKNSQIVNYI